MNNRFLGGKMRNRPGLAFVMLLLTVGAGIAIGTVLQRGASAAAPAADVNQLKISGEGQALGLDSPVSLQDGFAKVAQAVEPAVVNISTTQVIKAQSGSRRQRQPQPQGGDQPSDPFGDDFFNRFFGGQLPGGQGPEADRKVESLGSGVIVDGQGYILTNHHVVAQADRISAKLQNGEEFPATVVGMDQESDLAVIKIDARRPLPFARVGDSDKLKVGDWVLAIGSPFGFEQTVTAGIVSATHRNFLSDSFGDYLQTDAAINRGNSGGPLLNMRGEVVGINSFISSTSGGSVGVGFAIPSAVFANSYNQLVTKGKMQRGWLGVTMHTGPFTPEMAKFFGLKVAARSSDYGALITQLVDENGKPSKTAGPAAKAGIQEEDVIVEFSGKPIKNFFDLRAAVANTAPGQMAPVKVIRSGAEKVFDVKLEERTLNSQRAGDDTLSLDKREERPRDKEIGLNIRDLTPAQVGQMSLEGGAGVLVDEVRTGSLADDAGLASNMVIVKANGKELKSARQFYDYVSGLRSGEAIVLKVVIPAGAQRPEGMFYTSIVKP